MGWAVHLEPRATAPDPVTYRWEPETEILSARVTRPGGRVAGGAQVAELAGTDGCWLLLDVVAGAIDGVEVVIWPTEMHAVPLALPAEVEHVSARLAARATRGGLTADRAVPIRLEQDVGARAVHLLVGPPRAARTVRLAQSLLLDVDGFDEIAGIWLLDVPPPPQRRPLA